MKKIGLIGGIGWPSTIEYYQRICELSQKYHADIQHSGPTPMPEFSIESLDMNFTVNNRGGSSPDSWSVCDTYFNNALRKLEQSGAEIIAIASVTPHSRLKERSQGIQAPVLSIYDAIGAYCHNMGIRHLLVLGTMPTMTTTHFIKGVSNHDVKAFYPESEELKNQLIEIINNLYQNNVNSASRDIENLIRNFLSDTDLKQTAVCLACTELPIAFGDLGRQPQFMYNGISYLNSSFIHADAVFAECIR